MLLWNLYSGFNLGSTGIDRSPILQITVLVPMPGNPNSRVKGQTLKNFRIQSRRSRARHTGKGLTLQMWKQEMIQGGGTGYNQKSIQKEILIRMEEQGIFKVSFWISWYWTFLLVRGLGVI